MRGPYPIRCLLLGHHWGDWENDPAMGLDERHCRRRRCPGYDNRDDGTGWAERFLRLEAGLRVVASRPIVGDVPDGRPSTRQRR